MIGMAKKRPGRKKDPTSKRSTGADRHTDPRLAFHLEPELLAALEKYRASQTVPPVVSEVLRTSLREFLRNQGYWPPPTGD